jgi:hypothetical protein
MKTLVFVCPNCSEVHTASDTEFDFEIWLRACETFNLPHRILENASDKQVKEAIQSLEEQPLYSIIIIRKLVD